MYVDPKLPVAGRPVAAGRQFVAAMGWLGRPMGGCGEALWLHLGAGC